MKRIILLLTLASSTLLFSQMTIKDNVKPVLIGKANILMTETARFEKVGEKYKLTVYTSVNDALSKYNNRSFEMSFKATEDDINNLVVSIENNFKEAKKDHYFDVDLDGETLRFHFASRTQLRLEQIKDGEIMGVGAWLTKNQVMKLFGK